MTGIRLPAIGLGLIAAGFAWWALRALAFGNPVYVWMNVIRIGAAVLVLAGLVMMSRSRSAIPFRIGVFGFLAAAFIALVYNVTGTITLPEDLSTLFGFVGAVSAAYGAYHWFEPRGDALAAAWVTVGFGFMAANPGMYVLVGLVRGDLSQGGRMLGSLMACAGCILVATTLHRAVGFGAAAPLAAKPTPGRRSQA